MTETAAAAVEPAKEKTPQEYFTELRTWILANLSDSDPIRQNAYVMSLTAYVHRFIKFGPDDSLNHLNARDCMFLLIYTNGQCAEWLMRAAFTRAIIENDELITERLASSPFIAECSMWYWKLIEGITGQSPDPAALTQWLEALPKEEQSIARLIILRVFPDTAHMDWLNDVPDTNPRLQWELARIIAQKSDYKHAVDNWLRERPLARCQQFN